MRYRTRSLELFAVVLLVAVLACLATRHSDVKAEPTPSPAPSTGLEEKVSFHFTNTTASEALQKVADHMKVTLELEDVVKKNHKRFTRAFEDTPLKWVIYRIIQASGDHKSRWYVREDDDNDNNYLHVGVDVPVCIAPGIRPIYLEHAKATEVAAMIRQTFPEADVQTQEKDNLLVIKGYKRVLRKAMKLANELDERASGATKTPVGR